MSVWMSWSLFLLLLVVVAVDVGVDVVVTVLAVACSVESTALRLITGLGSAEVQPQLSRFLTDQKQVDQVA